VKDAAVRRWSAIHTGLYRMTGGVVGRRLVDNDMLLLTTVGRKSGRPHTVPLLYLEGDDELVVIASYGGRPDHPSWYKNLLESPEATVQLRRKRFPVTARMADDEERSFWWPRIVAAYDGYDVYQSRTNRVIPVVLLHRG